MTSRDGPIARAVRVAANDERHLLSELGRAQRSAGLSDEAVGRATRMSRWTVARIITGRRHASIVELAAIGAAVGIDVRARGYPAGDALRDAGQQRLLERFRSSLHPALAMRTEVPLDLVGDRRAWDALILGSGWRRPVEAETVLDDLQALERRLALKVRDGNVDGVILIVADTRRNRSALAAAPAAFSGFSRDARPVLRALRRGGDPGRNAIVLV
jgi:hypothetical protein